MKIKGWFYLCVAALTLALTGCGGNNKENVDYYDPETLGFTVTGEASLDDFTWLFTPKNYDKSNAAALNEDESFGRKNSRRAGCRS